MSNLHGSNIRAFVFSRVVRLQRNGQIIFLFVEETLTAKLLLIDKGLSYKTKQKCFQDLVTIESKEAGLLTHQFI